MTKDELLLINEKYASSGNSITKSRVQELNEKYAKIAQNSEKEKTEKQKSDSLAKELNKAGDNIWSHMPAIKDYEGVSQKKTTPAAKYSYDKESVTKLGMGPLSDDAVTEKLSAGELKGSVTKSGKVKVEINEDYSPNPTRKIVDATDERKRDTDYQIDQIYGDVIQEPKSGFSKWLAKNIFGYYNEAALQESKTIREKSTVVSAIPGAAANIAGSIVNASGYLLDLLNQNAAEQQAVDYALHNGGDYFPITKR